MQNAIELKNICKSFPGVKANDNISLAVKRGEIRALVGENGAGKTTLMNILYGLLQPDSGTIEINGEKCEFYSPMDAIKSGLGMVHQHFMLFSELSVVENIIYGMEPQNSGFIRKKQARNEVIELAKEYNLEVDPDAKVGNLPVGVQQRVEILKALYRKAQILIFDEPTAVLTPNEQIGFFEMLRKLAANEKTIIFITHKLNEVMQISHTISVMRLGKITAELKTAETNTQEISRSMVGRDVLFDLERKEINSDNVVLSVENLNVFDKNNIHILKDINFRVCEGEIVGIAGVAGNGQDELIRAIVGLSDANYIFGKIELIGSQLNHDSIKERRSKGLSYIPEDRNSVGLALQATVAENLVLGNIDDPEITRKGMLIKEGIRKFSESLRDQYLIKTNNIDEEAANLSGGNLQKVVVAREMNHQSKLLIAEQPTRGVDIGAIEHIHTQLLDHRSKNNAVLLVSTELSEIISLSDRILVMFEGQIIGESAHDEAIEESIGLMMAGVIPQGDRSNVNEN